MTNDELQDVRDRATCFGCEHFIFEFATPGYSEYTPGDDFRSGCAKQHWHHNCDMSETDYAKAIRTSQTCADFQLSKAIYNERNWHMKSTT